MKLDALNALMLLIPYISKKKTTTFSFFARNALRTKKIIKAIPIVSKQNYFKA